MDRPHANESAHHPYESIPNPSSHFLTRRILVAAITTLICVQVAAWSTHGIATLCGLSRWDRELLPLFVLFPTSLAFGASAALFSRWAARMDRGGRVWFSSWSTVSLFFCCALLLATGTVVPGPWDLLRSVFHIPQSFQFFWTFGFLSSGVARWGWTVLVTLLVLNYSILGLFWLAFRRARRKPGSLPTSVGAFAALALLWSSPALLYVIEVVALRYWSGMGDQRHELAEVLRTLPVQVATIAVALLACCSWVQWCGAARSGRGTIKVAAAWGALVLTHLALPSIGVYLAATKMADWSPYSRAFFQWPVANTDSALYLVLMQNLEQGLFWAPIGLVFIVFLVAIVVLTVETTRQKP
ncbi:MAG: hypothetical protein KF886_11335 [Candidatus Hydrogenedentes bacterium]|nr:hypothetical protein [Candidatus Hydrogenedentota bacterium]